MDRLYTAFVSSTYLDLIEERQVLAKALLDINCVPLGMETFPSAGRSQWPVILDSIRSSDFCVFMIAGRYGSVCPDAGISWTQKEFREARRLGKPVIALLHRQPDLIPAGKSETDERARHLLAQFREEIEAATTCRYFTDDTDLVSGLYPSVRDLEARNVIEGWVPAGKRPVIMQEADFDRYYELLDSEWAYTRSATDPTTWDAHHRGHRRVRATFPEGLRRCGFDFTRESDSHLPFSGSNSPTVHLLDTTRTGMGSMDLLPARKSTGSSYAQDVEFSPELGQDEVADFVLDVHLTRYKHAYREDLWQATAATSLGPRDFDYTSRNINYPTARLVTTVFLPDELGAKPAGPKIGRRGAVDQAASLALIRSGQYAEERVERDGVPGTLMRLDVEEPRYRWRYRVAWYLPPRPTT